MIKKQIAVDELRLGMYVVELDRPWLGSGFAFQGFPVTTADELAALKASCKTLFVDPERSRPSDASIDPELPRGSTIYPESKPVEQEFPVATQIYASCEASMKHLMETLRAEGEIEGELLRSAVESMAESIKRNPDAMLLLNRLRKKDSHELARAMDTSILMITFGRFLQFSPERLEILGIAGMLLDIGQSLVRNGAPVPRPLYCREPDETVKAHVLKSAELIRSTRGLPRGVDEVVMLHHERQDGEGYPYGLSGEGISIDGAIAALVDSFSGLTCTGPYGAQTSPSNALNLLHKMRGTLFHEALVEQFIQCIGIYPVGSAVELNTGEVGLVIAQNLVRRLQPRVMVIMDKGRQVLHPYKILDLVKEPKTSAKEIYRIRRTLPKRELPIDVNEFFV